MKLLLKDYLASLRERGELDAIVPDMLSELGFHVYSRPSVGTRQFGVDMAAVGEDDDKVRKVFLFSMKAGDLKRADWDDGPQALRPSLNEIKDHYIRSRIPAKYSGLPIVICICFGGDMDEAIQDAVRGYIESNSTDRISYQEWNGDRLAELLLAGVLREELLPEKSRSYFRKSLALLDEPDASYSYFRQLLQSLLDGRTSKSKVLTTATRQITICLWIMFVWARQLNNLEAAYRASEHALLHLWAASVPYLDKRNADARAIRSAIDQALRLYLTIAALFVSKLAVHADKRHGLSVAVRSMESLDTNLRMFDVLGRIALCGLWRLNLAQLRGVAADAPEFSAEAQPIASALISIVNNNPILLTPIRDEQAIDIGLACLLLGALGERDFISKWLRQIVAASAFSFGTDGKYPCILGDYAELLQHPKKADDEYLREVTSASVLYPTIAVWSALLGDEATQMGLTQLVSKYLPHTSMQLWFPGENSEPSLYLDDQTHGAALTGLRLTTGDIPSVLQTVITEAEASEHFSKLSASRFGFWALILTACRHYRYPIPPQFWLSFTKGADAS